MYISIYVECSYEMVNHFSPMYILMHIHVRIYVRTYIRTVRTYLHTYVHVGHTRIEKEDP